VPDGGPAPTAPDTGSVRFAPAAAQPAAGVGLAEPEAAPRGVLGRLRREHADGRVESSRTDTSADRAEPTAGRKALRSGIRILVVLAIAALAAGLLRAFVVAPFYIPSASMEPTLHGCSGCDNDHILVDKLSYRLHDPRRGDIVVFNRPDTWKVDEKVLVKRVIGLPGDVLSLDKGKLYVNGLQVDESYLDPTCPPMTTLSSAATKPVDKHGPVPAGDVFVLGDNRCDSLDSRTYGSVPESDIIGRAFAIIWPLSRMQTL
jgi:signal peptidase I